MKLMSYVINKIFRLDEIGFEDEVLQPFNKLFEKKKQKITDFYRELIEIPEFESEKPKYIHHSMCLTVDAVNHIFEFFKKNLNKFTTSKQSIVVLTNE
jgi:hypothetical protein